MGSVRGSGSRALAARWTPTKVSCDDSPVCFHFRPDLTASSRSFAQFTVAPHKETGVKRQRQPYSPLCPSEPPSTR